MTLLARPRPRSRHAVAPKALHELEVFLLGQGYGELRLIRVSVCGLHRYNFTTGLVVGLTFEGYERRYCYERAEDARSALLAWNGRDHPGGPWIKCKGAGIDLLNPAFGK